MPDRLHPLKIALLLVAGTLALAGCAARQDVRGAIMDEERLQMVQPGKATARQVVEILGSPSAVSTFHQRNQTWYYITREIETIAFFAPTVTDQKVVAIDFDERGQVKDVRRFTMADAQKVDVVDRETPTRGRELGLVEQLVGNVGRFSNQNSPNANR